MGRGLPGVENDATLHGSIFKLFRGSQLPYGEKSGNPSMFNKIIDSKYFVALSLCSGPVHFPVKVEPCFRPRLPLMPSAGRYGKNSRRVMRITAAQGTPNRGKGGKSINVIHLTFFLCVCACLRKWSWELGASR